jgi:hypothetical protein
MSDITFWTSTRTYVWPIMVLNGTTPVTSLTNADFIKRLSKDNATYAQTITIVEVDPTNNPGLYNVCYLGNTVGLWTSTVVQTLYAPIGYIDTMFADPSFLFNYEADHFWRRNYANSRAAVGPDTYAFRSPMGAVAKLVNKITVSAGTLTVYHEDDSTSAGTQAVTTTPGADPITTLDT